MTATDRPRRAGVPVAAPTTSEAVVSAYTSYLRGRGMSNDTLRARRAFLGRWLQEWDGLPEDSAVIATWLNRFTGWTRLTYHGHLTSIYSWQVEIGNMSASPMTKIKRPPQPTPRPRPLTPDEVATVINAASDERLRAWLMLAYLAGLRAHEIAKFHGRDIDRHSIYVLGKGGRGSTLPTHPALWDLASGYPGDAYWFPSTQHHRDHIHHSLVSAGIRAHFRDHGVTVGATHRLRATYGTSLLRGGANLRVVQTLMRHSSLATTEHYLGVDEDERMSAISRLGVRLS